MRAPVAMALDTRDKCFARNAVDGRFASLIDRRNMDFIGGIEAAREIIEQVAQARVTVGLADGDQLALAKHGARRLQQGERIAARQQVHGDRVARAPVGGNLQDRRTAEAAMGEQQRFVEAYLAEPCGDVERNAGKTFERRQHAGVEGQRHEPGARRNNGETELASNVVTEAGRPHFRDRRPAGGDDERRGGERAAIGLDGEAGCATVDAGDTGRGVQDGILRLVEQHVGDLLRRPVAEQLAVVAFVPGNAMAVDEGDEIARGVAFQRGYAEARIVRQVVVGHSMQVGEVCAAAAGNADLFAGPLGAFDHQHSAAAPGCNAGAHQARGARADNDDVEFGHARSIAVGAFDR